MAETNPDPNVDKTVTGKEAGLIMMPDFLMMFISTATYITIKKIQQRV